MKTRQRRQGFTLVEVLLVVVILAILAATVIPQFTTSGEDAKDSALNFNLQTLRSQIQLYRLQHGGQNPDEPVAGVLQGLVMKTMPDGTVSEDGTLGPYLVSGVPVNPLNNSAEVAATTADPPTAAVGESGWLYNKETGGIWPNSGNPSDY